jgi:hypothetical protein
MTESAEQDIGAPSGSGRCVPNFTAATRERARQERRGKKAPRTVKRKFFDPMRRTPTLAAIVH